VAVQQAQIEALKVMQANDRRELKRKTELLANKDVSQSEVDQLQAKVDQQEAQIAGALATLEAEKGGLLVMKHNIEAAEAEIAKAKDNLTYATMTSPIDGVVTRLNAEVGEVVMTGTMNNAGTVILEVADLSQMVLRAFVDESAIAQVREKQTANVRLEAYRDKVFKGVVQSVALANYDSSMARGGARTATASGGGKTFEVVILIDTDGYRFFSGLSADAEIETKRFDSVIKVPSQAVLARSPDSLPERARGLPVIEKGKASIPVVYRYVDGKAVATPVRIGTSDMTHTVIEAGLSAGDMVITGPYKALEPLADGQQVKADIAAAPESPATSPSTTPATSPSS
jgi:HlyD family secretion protein